MTLLRYELIMQFRGWDVIRGLLDGRSVCFPTFHLLNNIISPDWRSSLLLLCPGGNSSSAKYLFCLPKGWELGAPQGHKSPNNDLFLADYSSFSCLPFQSLSGFLGGARVDQLRRVVPRAQERKEEDLADNKTLHGQWGITERLTFNVFVFV